MDFKAECDAKDAPRFREWIASRGGIAIWKSINLSNPGASWTTPVLDAEGKPNGKPTWQAANEPTVVTDPAQVGVYNSVLYKAFRVGLRRSFSGFKLTDGAQKKVDKALDECREKYGNAHFRKGVLPIDGASIGIYYSETVVPLTEFKEEA